MKRLFTKFLAMALTAALLIELLPAANAVATNAVTVDDSYADSHVVGEVNEERTETGKRFRLADGSYAAVEYGAPVHYADDDGNWQDIDNTLALQNADRAASVRTYESVNGTHEKDFAASLTDGFLFSSSVGTFIAATLKNLGSRYLITSPIRLPLPAVPQPSIRTSTGILCSLI